MPRTYKTLWKYKLGKQNDTKFHVAMGKDPEAVTEVGTYSVVHEKIWHNY